MKIVEMIESSQASQQNKSEQADKDQQFVAMEFGNFIL